jgi:isopenicillin N synthase-like dioxygenase
MSFVPTVDIAAWGADVDGDARIAHVVDQACRTAGFFEITGHLVGSDVLAPMLAAADAFFDLPDEVKRRYAPPSPRVNRGYAAKGTEALALSLGIDTPPDLFEAFNVGVEGWVPGDLAYGTQTEEFFAPNIWPAEQPELRDAVMTYFRAAARQSAQLLEILAVALGVQRDFFAPFVSHSTDTMRINCYRRSAGEEEPLTDQQRMGAHTDYGMVTVLYADSVPGLEIVGPDGVWHGHTPRRGSLLVNLGDLMAHWTNDVWRSSLHRVVPPPRQVNGPALRRSVAFFRDGNPDALVETFPSCITAERPARYAPVTAGDHLRAKLLGPRILQPSAASSTAGDRVGALTPKR